MSTLFRKYTGEGISRKSDIELPEPIYKQTFSGSGYVPGESLVDAVNVALNLSQPLLLMGEPGTGKTRLAYSLGHEFDLPVVEFRAKTDASAKDLFYSYDSVGRFHDAQVKNPRADNPENYVFMQGLGLAILNTNPQQHTDIPNYNAPENAHRSIVLLDEIDKAPRDFPNDILNEVEKLSYNIDESGRHITVNEDLRPIIIITSNSEKNLPDAFLRRCVFHHISFPDTDLLRRIIKSRLPDFDEQLVESGISMFEEVRNLNLRKAPGTAELLAWLSVLQLQGVKDTSKASRDVLATSFAVLVKHREDIEEIQRVI